MNLFEGIKICIPALIPLAAKLLGNRKKELLLF